MQEYRESLKNTLINVLPTYSGDWKLCGCRKTSAQAPHLLSASYPYISFSFTPRFHTAALIDKPLLWYLCHIFNMDMGMIIKSIVAKGVLSALNNGWARKRLNLRGRTERQGEPQPSTPPPIPIAFSLSGTSLFWSIFSPLAWHHSM